VTKAKQVTVKMDVHTAAAVRQILFESQVGYTSDILSVPSRIFNVREVIADLDDAISSVVE
jgi:hypothetical protein